MNSLSFWLIALSGLFIGAVFPALLEELGVSRKVARSLLVALALPLLAFGSFVIYPLFTHGAFMMVPVSSVYTGMDGIFLWFTVALLLGSIGRAFLYFIEEQRKT